MLTWSKYYQGKPLPKDPLKYFRDFSLDDVIQILIWVKNSLEIPGKHFPFVKALVRRMDKGKRNYFLNQFQKIQVSQPIVIDKILIEVFKTHSTKSSERHIGEIGFEDQLLDLLLCFNELHYEPNKYSFDAISPEAMWSLSIDQDTTGLDNIAYARTANIKHLIFLKFLRLHFGDNYQLIEESFKKKTKLNSIYDLIVNLIQFYSTSEVGEASHFLIPNFNAEHCLILEKLSLIIDQENLPDPKYNLGIFVSHPYYKSGDQVFLLDRNYFAFALEKSWPYFFYKNSSIIDFLPGMGKFSDFQSLIGKDYIEGYFLENLLSSLSKSGFRWVKPLEKYMPDGCYVINESKVILFEFKSSSLHFNVMEQQDIHKFKNFLDDNFAKDKKGASQLVNAIRHLSENSNSSYGIKTNINKLTVYPVIIFTEMNLSMLGVNDYVDSHFQEQLGMDAKLFQEVKPLTMIHLDFFTENISLLKNDRSLLRNALDHYLKYTRKKKSIYFKSQLTADYLSAQIQFDKYIIGYKKLYQLPQKDIFKNLSKLFDLK